MQVALYLAGEITQVKESIPWVRCASGNVSQLYFKEVGGVGAASEVILTTRSRVVSDPQEESLLM